MKKPLLKSLEEYVLLNPERFNNDEKIWITYALRNYMSFFDDEIKESRWATNDLYDFFTYLKSPVYPARHKILGDYIIKNFPASQFKKVADIGAGRMCRLSEYLFENGYDVTAFDTNIRLEETENKKFRFKKKLILSEEYTGEKQTDLYNFDIFAALELCSVNPNDDYSSPCVGPQHIISEGILKNKAFAVAFCTCQHAAFDGTTFKSQESFFDYLIDKYKKLTIEKEGHYYIASNKEFVQ